MRLPPRKYSRYQLLCYIARLLQSIATFPEGIRCSSTLDMRYVLMTLEKLLGRGTWAETQPRRWLLRLKWVGRLLPSPIHPPPLPASMSALRRATESIFQQSLDSSPFHQWGVFLFVVIFQAMPKHRRPNMFPQLHEQVSMASFIFQPATHAIDCVPCASWNGAWAIPPSYVYSNQPSSPVIE